ncbi:protein NRT1/ PTR FAMILY 8.3-like [Triticum urartu]|uniref:Peptide transporter PTR2 n=1 Tax=Triticum urartu TaxID=4572 RepID=A0A8R7R447_TRIUA|nr:protein NRT1/ PTR FAMILY 8.3-like [Triticum urartu]
MEAADEERPLLNRHRRPAQTQDESSSYTSDGTVDIYRQPALKQSTGNWRACFFILGAEFSECMCFFAVAKNLVTYLTTVLHESNVDAARNVSTWIGSCFLTPVIGAFLADSYWGRYTTIAVFLSVYIVGMLIVTSSAALPFLLPRSSDESGGVHPAAVYLGLYLVALGTGGIKPCAAALGADQFDGADPMERVAKGSFFNWYYFSINIGSLLAATLLVWVQDNIGWTVGFGIPTVLIGFGLAVFVAGGRIYRYKPLGRGGSPLARVFQVVVAATRNCRLELPDDSSALHENDRAERTSQFTFFDKAAIVLPSSEKKGPWRLCTVSQVEELKTLLRMSPVWASLLIFFAVTAQMSSTLIEQGMAMDKRVGAFVVPPASLSTFDVISVLVWVPIYDAVLVPLARRVTGEDRGFTQLQRIGVGLALSAAGMAYAALIETRRLAAPATSMSIMWQAPCYFVLGAAEVFASIGMLEFFYDQSPGSMKSLGAALALLAIAGGNYLNSVLLGAVASTTGWIADNLDQGHLDYFFWFMAALSVLNLLQFVYCSTRYKSIDQH